MKDKIFTFLDISVIQKIKHRMIYQIYRRNVNVWWSSLLRYLRTNAVHSIKARRQMVLKYATWKMFGDRWVQCLNNRNSLFFFFFFLSCNNSQHFWIQIWQPCSFAHLSFPWVHFRFLCLPFLFYICIPSHLFCCCMHFWVYLIHSDVSIQIMIRTLVI